MEIIEFEDTTLIIAEDSQTARSILTALDNGILINGEELTLKAVIIIASQPEYVM